MRCSREIIVVASMGRCALLLACVLFLSSDLLAVEIGFELPDYTDVNGHGDDGGLAGQGGGGDPGCPDGGNQVGCWDNIFNPNGFTVTPGVGFGGTQGLTYETGVNVFGPHIFQTDDALLGGTFDSASSVLDYSFVYRMDTIGSGFGGAFDFAVTGADDHFEYVMKIGAQDHGGMFIEHGGHSDSNDKRTYLAKIGDAGTPLLPAPAFNVISGQIDYANQTFTVNINGSNYSYQSSQVTNNGGNYAFRDTTAAVDFPSDKPRALDGANIVLLAGNQAGANDATYTIDDLKLEIAAAVPGDFDGDGDVDGADFLTWQRDDASAGGLTEWQGNYGASGSLSASLAAVPEPSSLILACCAMMAGLGRRRFR